MKELADRTDPDRVVCKMSGLWTQAPAGSPVEVVRPWCETLLKIWGPRRLLWGSDWPVLELAGPYEAWHAISLEVLAHLAPDEQSAVWFENARRIYQL
jgi:L-fuconolactonase